MKKLVFGLSVAICMMGQANAADVNNSYAIKGAGIAGCSKFLESVEKKDSVYYVYGGWIEGYVTSQNLLQKDTFDIAPWQSTGLLLKVAESICKKQPELKFHQIMGMITAELIPQKLGVGGQFVSVGTPDKPIVFQMEMIERIQQALSNKGFGGVIDGVYGESSQAAMKDFQSSRGLSVTGSPDQASLFELFKPEQK